MKNLKTSHTVVRLVVIVSVLIAVVLGFATRDITFWPADAKDFYLDCALQLMHVKYISQVHEDLDAKAVRWGHGKEIFFLFISFLQRALLDFETLRPIILLNLGSICFSAILVFLIARRFWGQDAGIISWFCFTFSVWPYLYILFAKHQPLGLFFFLLAVYVLFYSADSIRGRLFFWLSGFIFGCSLFSSTPSALYLPCLCAAYVYRLYSLNSDRDFSLPHWLKTFTVYGLLVCLGTLTTFLYVNSPDVAYNLKSYMTHVHLSGHHNHFFYNQPYLQQWFPLQHVADVRGGWLWVLKYFFLIMPVLLPVYGLSLGFLICICFKDKGRFFITTASALIFVSLAAPLMAEIAPVAQYGANYFPCLMGIIVLIGYACWVAKQNGIALFKGRFTYVILCVGFLHLGINLSMFLDDVYPTRMCKTFLSKKIKDLKIHRIFSYRKHPHLQHFLPSLTPDVYKNMRFVAMATIAQVPEGVILIPPSTGDSIYLAMTSRYNHFADDLFLNALVARNRIQDYALASYKTIANSRIWVHEEEIFSYRSLILNHPFKDNELLARVWLLDAGKFHADIKKNMPLPRDLDAIKNDFLNIGSERKFFIFEGYQTIDAVDKTVRQIVTQISKIGNPQDSLVAYVYKVDKDEAVWIPAAENFFSQPLPARQISTGPEGLAVFRFPSPLQLQKGRHLFVFYRSGKPDDNNFYRIKKSRIAVQ